MTPASDSAAVGYASPIYAGALGHLGRPRPLPASGGTLLLRDIDGATDAAGAYPLFACDDWGGLRDDLDAIGDEVVSTTLVTDPFGSWTPELLETAFPDLARPFKQHLVVDLSLAPAERTSSHHRRNARKAREQLEVEEVPAPVARADDWCELYSRLIERHAIQGPAAFPPASLRAQLEVPGARLWRAALEGATVGAVLWYVRGDVASYHLAAYTEEGYDARASFALFDAALDALAKERIDWAHLGAGAGTQATTDDGLTRFKRGWATGSKPAWICGRIHDSAAYDALVRAAGEDPTDASFFPLYRKRELR